MTGLIVAFPNCSVRRLGIVSEPCYFQLAFLLRLNQLSLTHCWLNASWPPCHRFLLIFILSSYITPTKQNWDKLSPSKRLLVPLCHYKLCFDPHPFILLPSLPLPPMCPCWGPQEGLLRSSMGWCDQPPRASVITAPPSQSILSSEGRGKASLLWTPHWGGSLG